MSKKLLKKRIFPYCILIASLLLILQYVLPQNHSNAIPKQLAETRFALNTVVSITLYGTDDKDILENAFSLCTKYENIFSRTLESSELYKVNHSPETTITVSDELASLIKTGLEYSKLSDGAFDITIAPISSLWDFSTESPTIPDEELIKKNLSYVGFKNANIDGNTLTRSSSNIQFDLGAIAKGYIADRIKEYLESVSVEGATISLGGNVLCVGQKPDGSSFNIGIQAPFEKQNETLMAIKLKDKSVVTSGIYERYFKIDDTLYHHILNPKTGFPYSNNLVSVSIISDKSVDGDALSTMCFSLGLDAGLKYINSKEGLDAVFITADGTEHYSNSLESNYEITHT